MPLAPKLQPLTRLTRLLKIEEPGGYVQWGEPSIPSFRMETVEPGIETKALTEIMEVFQEADQRLQPTWASKLPEVFDRAGLEEIQASSAECPPYMALATQECNFALFDIIVRTTRNTETARKLKELFPRALEESRSGAICGFTRFTAVGRKRTDGS